MPEPSPCRGARRIPPGLLLERTSLPGEIAVRPVSVVLPERRFRPCLTACPLSMTLVAARRLSRLARRWGKMIKPVFPFLTQLRIRFLTQPRIRFLPQPRIHPLPRSLTLTRANRRG